MTAVTLTADGTTSVGGKAKAMVRDSVKTVIAASMVGTAIEFYDFYAYGTAAANYFPHIFFSAKDNPTVALLMSLLTFAIAFIARPLGSLIFGHFGDRMGRKTTLVVSLMTMGVGTFLIGCLPTYDHIAIAAAKPNQRDGADVAADHVHGVGDQREHLARGAMHGVAGPRHVDAVRPPGWSALRWTGYPPPVPDGWDPAGSRVPPPLPSGRPCPDGPGA